MHTPTLLVEFYRRHDISPGIASFVAPGGVLVITCVDPISILAERLRRLMANLLSSPDEALARRVAVLEPVFAAHLSRLAGVSRRRDDWVIDNLINPASIGPLFSIPQALESIGAEFDVFGTSPHFVADWRWYKTIVTQRGDFNAVALDAYWQHAHNLLDSRVVTAARAPGLNQALFDRCTVIRDAVREFERAASSHALETVGAELDVVAEQVGLFAPSTAAAVRAAQALISSRPPDANAMGASEPFGAWFGRGQQYLSFSRPFAS